MDGHGTQEGDGAASVNRGGRAIHRERSDAAAVTTTLTHNRRLVEAPGLGYVRLTQYAVYGKWSHKMKQTQNTPAR